MSFGLEKVLARSAAVTLVPLSTLLGGCICPPCQGVAPATASADTGGGGGDNPQPADSVATPKEVAAGASEMIWDGDTAAGTAQGWADCDKKPGCKATVAPSDTGVDGGKGIFFHGEGPGWIGMGWNWHGWYPENAGTDISPYDTLSFSIKVDAKSEELAPPVSAMTIGLRCSKGKKDSAGVTLEKYWKDRKLGEWKAIEIPLSEFYKGKQGKEFDPHSAWEIGVSTWSESERAFDVTLDNVAVKKN